MVTGMKSDAEDVPEEQRGREFRYEFKAHVERLHTEYDLLVGLQVHLALLSGAHSVAVRRISIRCPI